MVETNQQLQPGNQPENKHVTPSSSFPKVFDSLQPRLIWSQSSSELWKKQLKSNINGQNKPLSGAHWGLMMQFILSVSISSCSLLSLMSNMGQIHHLCHLHHYYSLFQHLWCQLVQTEDDVHTHTTHTLHTHTNHTHTHYTRTNYTHYTHILTTQTLHTHTNYTYIITTHTLYTHNNYTHTLLLLYILMRKRQMSSEVI